MKVTINYTSEVRLSSTEFEVSSLKDVYIKDDIWLVIYTSSKELVFIALRYIMRYAFDNISQGELDEYSESQSGINRQSITAS